MTRWSGPGPARCRLAVAVAVSALVAPAAAAGAAVSPDDNPLQAAGQAAEHVSFVGTLRVTWSDGQAQRSETLLVQGGNGSVVVRGGTAVMAADEQRLVEKAGGEWSLLSPGGQPGGSGRPAADRKYELRSAPGPVVSSRTSRLVEVRRAGDLLERVYLDQETDLLLRREQFEDGALVRTVEFESLTIGAGNAPTKPASVVNGAPRVVTAGNIPRSVSAPVTLADGYQRVGVYRKSGVVQARYSDGLYDLSVFEQEGTLAGHDLPGASRVALGRPATGGWHYSWPGGHVVLWEKEGRVYAAVSDAPLEQVLTAVGSLPPVAASVPLLHRLREACRTLIQPFAA